MIKPCGLLVFVDSEVFECRDLVDVLCGSAERAARSAGAVAGFFLVPSGRG
jgi:hypothetical protein